MAEPRSLICITCPMGCQLDVQFDADAGRVLGIAGNSCQRALAYAEKELTNPMRMVTTTVRVRGGRWPVLPVHTREPVPKSAIFPLLCELRTVEVEAPVRCGQVILANGANTGVDVLASRDLPANAASEAATDPTALGN